MGRPCDRAPVLCVPHHGAWPCSSARTRSRMHFQYPESVIEAIFPVHTGRRLTGMWGTHLPRPIHMQSSEIRCGRVEKERCDLVKQHSSTSHQHRTPASSLRVLTFSSRTCRSGLLVRRARSGFMKPWIRFRRSLLASFASVLPGDRFAEGDGPSFTGLSGLWSLFRDISSTCKQRQPLGLSSGEIDIISKENTPRVSDPGPTGVFPETQRT